MLNSVIKSRYVFDDLCNTESKDREYLHVANKYFEDCRNSYFGKKIIFINVRDEGLKFIEATYKCVENKSHYKLPSLGDYLRSLHEHKISRHKILDRAVDTMVNAVPSAASGINLTEEKLKFFRQDKASCHKQMPNVHMLQLARNFANAPLGSFVPV